MKIFSQVFDRTYSVQVVDRSCQVSEDEIIRAIAAQAAKEQSQPTAPTAVVQKSESFSSLPEQRCSFEDASVEGYSVPRLEDLQATGMDILEMQGVCEDAVDGPAGHEEFFNKKFDQLAKLHELYQSVSSINAKCQSRLENDR